MAKKKKKRKLANPNSVTGVSFLLRLAGVSLACTAGGQHGLRWSNSYYRSSSLFRRISSLLTIWKESFKNKSVQFGLLIAFAK